MEKSSMWKFSARPVPNGARGFLTLALLAILVATLEPTQIDEYATNAFCLLCPWDTVDILENILLFAPLGIALSLRGVGGGWGLMTSMSLSLTVEVAQIWIPGRDASLTDVVSNTLGAAVGIAVAHTRLGDMLSIALSMIARVLTRPEPRLASRLALGAAMMTSVVFTLTDVLLTPSFPRTTYFVGMHTLENARTPLRIGGDTIYGEHMHGIIDEVRIYNRAQTTTEIRQDMNTPVSGAPPGADLVAAYGFDEGAGIAVHDTSGHGNTGTMSGATWTDQGRFGRALMFNGRRSLVSIPPSPALDLTEGMTLSAWVYPMSRMTGWRLVVKKEIDAYFLTASSEEGFLRPAGGGTFGSLVDTVEAATPIAVNAWGHLALTYDGATLCLYVHGNQVVCRARWYPGRVLSISVGDLLLSPGAVFDSSALHMRLRGGAPLRVRAQAVRHPIARPLPLLRVIGKDDKNILSLSADHEDLVWRVRTRATIAGFNSPDVLFRRVMRDLSPSEPFTVTLQQNHDRWCAGVNGTVTCAPGFTIGTGWALLFPSQYLSVPLQTVLNWFWIAALVWPVGFWARGHVETIVAGILLVMSIWVLPHVTNLAPIPLVEVGATMMGLLMGVALRLTRDQTAPCKAAPRLNRRCCGIWKVTWRVRSLR